MENLKQLEEQTEVIDEKVELTPEELILQYENELVLAREKYKTLGQALEFAFDPFEEECIKDEREIYKKEVKDLRAKIDLLMAKA